MAPDDDAPETPEPAAEAADGDQADAPADEPAVVTTEVQPPTDEVEDVQPEPIPPAEMLHGVLMSRSRALGPSLVAMSAHFLSTGSGSGV